MSITDKTAGAMNMVQYKKCAENEAVKVHIAVAFCNVVIGEACGLHTL